MRPVTSKLWQEEFSPSWRERMLCDQGIFYFQAGAPKIQPGSPTVHVRPMTCCLKDVDQWCLRRSAPSKSQIFKPNLPSSIEPRREANGGVFLTTFNTQFCVASHRGGIQLRIKLLPRLGALPSSSRASGIPKLYPSYFMTTNGEIGFVLHIDVAVTTNRASLLETPVLFK